MASEGVMSTNDDASSCKRYATYKKYWKDDFIQFFIRSTPPRKAPEINRGYYLRHFSIKNIVDQFLNITNCTCQIVSLGCGFDTLFWNLDQRNLVPSHGFYEIDLRPTVQKKIHLIKTRAPLQQALKGDIKHDSSQLHSKDYHLISGDLKDIPALKQLLTESGVDNKLPTLFILECVLVYIEPQSAQNLLNFICKDFRTSLIIDYDPVNLNDRFGQVMKLNLKDRDCVLYGAHDSLSLKMKTYSNFSYVVSKLLIDIYNDLPSSEKSRIEKIEFLDEVDLLFDLLKHYCICIASNDDLNMELKSIKI